MSSTTVSVHQGQAKLFSFFISCHFMLLSGFFQEKGQVSIQFSGKRQLSYRYLNKPKTNSLIGHMRETRCQGRPLLPSYGIQMTLNICFFFPLAFFYV